MIPDDHKVIVGKLLAAKAVLDSIDSEYSTNVIINQLKQGLTELMFQLADANSNYKPNDFESSIDYGDTA